MQQKEIKQAKSIENVFNSAYWHLAQQDFTIAEIRSKLERKTENQAWIEVVLATLIEKNYIKNNIDFAIQFADSAFRNQLGQSAIKKKLRARGITEEEACEAIEQVIEDEHIDQFELACSRLNSTYQNFHSTTKEKLYSQLTAKGFSRAEIDHAIAMHPEKDSLRTKLEVKADKADLSNEILKLFRKGKGKTLILRELKARLIDTENFEDTLYRLEEDGDIDFYQSCQDALNKKRYDIAKSAEKSKAYAYLSRKGFSSDEIKTAFNPDE